MTSPSRILCAVCLLLLTVTPAHHPPEQVPVVAADPVTVIPAGELHDELYAYAAATTTTTSTLPPPTTTVQREGNLGAQTAQSRRSYSGDPGVWDRIAECESGGDWATNTGNGYYGGLQMDMQFWRSYGGPEFAERPDLASREQQIVVAERARDSGRGYRPWPVCGARA